jgi:thioredoxin-related protein
MCPMPRRRAHLLRLVGLALGAVVAEPLRAREAGVVPRIDDLRALAQLAQREKQPILLFFSTPGCPFCQTVRSNYLAPRVREGRSAGAIIREVQIDGTRTLLGRDGQPLTESALARRFDIRAVPVVLLVDADLQPLSDPLVGYDRAGFYETYLANAIQTARARMAAR